MPPGDFFGIQILQNSILAGAPPWTPQGKLTMLPIPLVGWIPPPHSQPSAMPLASRYLRHWGDWPAHFSDASAAYGITEVVEPLN